MPEDKEHIGIAIFKIVHNLKEISQKELINILLDNGYRKYQAFLYIKYILTVPIPVRTNEFFDIFTSKFADTMIIRDATLSNSKRIMIKLNKDWEETDDEAVVRLFNALGDYDK